MLTPEEDVEITSLRKRGWTISAIARHVGHDRKTVRGYLSGEREPGVRARQEPDPFDRFEPYVRQRLSDDQHVWATTLSDEIVALGYERSYQTFTRQLRDRQLRPHCEPCSSSNGRVHVDIEHQPGEEIQWDWLELEATPWGEKAYVLVGALAHSGRFRGWFPRPMIRRISSSVSTRCSAASAGPPSASERGLYHQHRGPRFRARPSHVADRGQGQQTRHRAARTQSRPDDRPGRR
jgi:transposase